MDSKYLIEFAKIIKFWDNSKGKLKQKNDFNLNFPQQFTFIEGPGEKYLEMQKL